ncbi:MAG: hypothetical protein WBQ76_12375 [Candidatus Korobacteraceae bacterium]
MTSVKATLTVILKANDVVVAEVDDAALWQRILTAINDGKSTMEPVAPLAQAGLAGGKGAENSGPGIGGALDQLSTQLGIDLALVQGACSPSIDPPYMHLDPHCWEVMKKQLPTRGPTTISPIATAATLLGLWFQKASLGNPTQSQAQTVLGMINITDRNASRSIQNTSWLQRRSGGQIVLNAAEISKAVKLAKCFCSKDWAAWKEPANS